MLTAGSPFTDPLAVEVWDARFRCRENGRLRDLTIESTWDRVATAAASVEKSKAHGWAERFVQAFADWRLLPGEDILQSAGTRAAEGWALAPTAVLNAAAFVRAPFTSRARFDTEDFATVVGLAVRLLDNMLMLGGETARVPSMALRIGLIGFADAAYMMGLRYDSDAARGVALGMAQAMAESSLAGAARLAADRGAAETDREAMLRRCQRRGITADTLRDVNRYGVRHAELTTIESHLSLALLANNVADALDPLCGPDQPHPMETPNGIRVIRSSGAAISLARRRHPAGEMLPIDTIANVPVEAQLTLRAMIQPWIDAPINYPISHLNPPTAAMNEQATAMAQALGLPRPSWRNLDALVPMERAFAF